MDIAEPEQSVDTLDTGTAWTMPTITLADLGTLETAQDVVALTADCAKLLRTVRSTYCLGVSDDLLSNLTLKLGLLLDFTATVATQPAVAKLRTAVAGYQRTVALVRKLHQLPGAQPAKVLHFFWSGRQISDTALGNIQSWAALAKTCGWKVIIWSDQQNQNWPVAVKWKLYWADVTIRDITQAVLHPLLWPAYTALIHGDTPNFPAASDLARYSILFANGGVYLDVDLAPGRLVDLNPFHAVIRVPLLAPLLRDLRAIQENDKLAADELPTPDRILEFAAQVLADGQYNNNFIVCPAGLPAMDAVITYLAAKLKPGDIEDLAGIGANAAAALTGPFRVRPALVAYLATVLTLSSAEANELLVLALDLCPPLAWLTAESEFQVH